MSKRAIKKLQRLFFLSLLLSLLLSACRPKPPHFSPILPEYSKDATSVTDADKTRLALHHATPMPQPTQTPWPVSTSTPVSTPTTPMLSDVNPLTGLKVSNPSLLHQRPLLVKIGNWPESLRPADGLNKADMVFEYYNDDFTNQILALYYGDDHPHVGPLVEGRVIDARITEHQQGILVLAGGDDIFRDVLKNYLQDRYLMRGSVPCPGICTDTVAQGGLTYVDTNALRDRVASQSSSDFIPSLFGLTFSEAPPVSKDAATRFSYIYADFSVTDWRYIPEEQHYELWQDKSLSANNYTLSKSYDRGTGEAITFENILFLYTKYSSYRQKFYDINFDDGNTQQPGILIRDGQLYHIIWSVANYDEPFLIYKLNGEPMPLKPGRTWITLATIDSTIEQVNGTEWDMHFIIK